MAEREKRERSETFELTFCHKSLTIHDLSLSLSLPKKNTGKKVDGERGKERERSLCTQRYKNTHTHKTFIRYAIRFARQRASLTAAILETTQSP